MTNLTCQSLLRISPPRNHAWLFILAGALALHARLGIGQTTNFEEHIRPIFREHCSACHNAQKESSGLSLDSYARVLQGGASGEVVFAADLGSSRLWALVNHDEQPVMPPNQDRISDDKLTLIRQWIEQGLLERSDSAPVAKAKGGLASVEPAIADDAPGVMPTETCAQPVAVATRPAAISALATSPKAPLLAIAGQHQVLLYNTETAELITILPFLEGTITTVRFSRDSGLLLVAGGIPAKSGCCVLYDIATGRRVARLGDELDAILSADLDRARQTIAFGSSNKLIRGLDVLTGTQKYEMKKHTDWVTAVDMSPDGMYLATADRQGGLVVWEVAAGREYQVHEGHAAAVTSVSWRSDSKFFATSSEDGTVRLWDREKVKAERSWDAHPGGALSVRFGRNGNLVSVGRDRTPKLWNTDAANIGTFSPLPDVGLCADLSADGKFVFAGDWSGHVKVYTTEPPADRGELDANPPRLEDRAQASQQAVAAAQADSETRRSLLAQLTAARDAAVVEFEAAVAKFRTTRTEVETTRQQSTAAGQPVDLSSRDAEVVELERTVGRLAANRQQVEEGWQDNQRSSQAADELLSQRTTALAQATAALEIYRQRPELLTSRVTAAEAIVGEKDQQIVAEDQLLVTLDQLVAAGAKTLAEYNSRHGDTSAESARLSKIAKEIDGERVRQQSQCAAARSAQQIAQQGLEATRRDLEFFKQAYPTP